MKNDRPGEWLWEQWDGEGFNQSNNASIIYVTFDSVDIYNDVVKRALASCIQRDGVSDSLADGFAMIERSSTTHGFVGFIEGEKFPFVTDEFGYTMDGEDTDYISEATWIEISA